MELQEYKFRTDTWGSAFSGLTPAFVAPARAPVLGATTLVRNEPRRLFLEIPWDQGGNP